MTMSKYLTIIPFPIFSMFYRFIQRSIDVELTILKLLPYAKELKHGYMVEKEIEIYIFELISEIAGCRNLPESFYPFYVFTASRRFFFYLDSKYSYRKLSIDILAHSTVMEEFLFFKRLSDFEHQQEQQNNQNDDHGKQPVVTESSGANWFSSENAMNVYTNYINLDKDQNGMLSQRELISLNSCICGINPSPIQLTSIAVSRIFEEYITFDPREMDYKTFLDLILALENKTCKQSLQYFWRVLDIEKSGRLSAKNIEYFYNDIFNCLKSLNYEAPSLHNIIIEIYDILSSNHPDGPTFKEFVDSGQGHTVITMLLDVHGFWSYDNRETIIAQQQAEAQQQERLKQEDQHFEKSSSRSPLTNHSSSSSSPSLNNQKQWNKNQYDDDEDDNDEYNGNNDAYYNDNEFDDTNSSDYNDFEEFNERLRDTRIHANITTSASTSTAATSSNGGDDDNNKKGGDARFVTAGNEADSNRRNNQASADDDHKTKPQPQQKQPQQHNEDTVVEDYVDDDYYDDDFND